MKRQLQIITLLFLTNYSFVYCQEVMTKNNSLKISILSFLDNAKIQYERTLNQSSTFGLTASYYYIEPITGIKIEPSYRYYFKIHAPTGWYIEPKISMGYFKTREPFYTEKYTYNSNDSLINMEITDGLFFRNLNFFPIGISLKFGRQAFFGKSKRFVFDYNFGFQYFPYNYPNDQEINEYFDNAGNKIRIVTTQGTIKDAIPGNYLFWYLIGPGSVFYTNISLGYNF